MILDLLQIIVRAQAAVPNNDACVSGDMCPATSFTAIAAAFATQGYYRQASFLDYLNNTGLSQIAGLIYILAGFAGLVSMVLGMPPRNYMWFFIGPAVYHWLVGTPVEVQGVRWMAPNQQASAVQQAEVWKLAEAGLANEEYLLVRSATTSRNAPPSEPARVSLFFAWVDDFVSHMVHHLVLMSGVFEQNGQGGQNTKLDEPPNGAEKNWSILSDLKWGKLEEITAAKLRNGDTRDAFVTFLASECGDVFVRNINEAAWGAAASGDGKNIPTTVFTSTFVGTLFGVAEGSAINKLIRELRQQAIPIPDAFRNLILNGYAKPTFLIGPVVDSKDTFTKSAPFLMNEVVPYLERNASSGGIACDSLLWVIIHAFRYEAGHIFYQLVDGAPGEFERDMDSIVYNLLYGWGIGNSDKGAGSATLKRQNFLIDLILVHLIRNEMAIAPQPVDLRYASSQEAKNYVDAFARTVGSKTKYGEVYSWALMVPYIQGVMLYVLALAYPFAALMVIIPGWHKTILTWASFWVWVKSWDLGFAVVKVLERSIWAMIGNGSNAEIVNQKVLELSRLGQVNVVCDGTVLEAFFGQRCTIPTVSFGGAGLSEGMNSMTNTFTLFGRALALAANLDLDLSNSYYIYIMAALYFSVPAVTGQLFLGAKAGASSMVGGMISGFGDKVSAGASSGYTGDMAQKIQTNMGSVGQASYAKAMRGSGLGEMALMEGNSATASGAAQQVLSTQNQMLGTKSGTLDRTGQSIDSLAGMLKTGADLVSKGTGDAVPETTGANPQTAGGKLDTAKNLAKGGLGVAGRAGVAGISFAQNAARQQILGEQNGIAQQQANNTAQGFDHAMEQSRAGLNGQRVGQYGDYNASMKAWEAKRNFGNQISGNATIGGLFAGAIQPGEKPRGQDGMAMAGILDNYAPPKKGGDPWTGSTYDHQGGWAGGSGNAGGTARFAARGDSFQAGGSNASYAAPGGGAPTSSFTHGYGLGSQSSNRIHGAAATATSEFNSGSGGAMQSTFNKALGRANVNQKAIEDRILNPDS